MDNQLITCAGLDCSLCSLLQTISNIFYYLLGISLAVAVLFLVIGGFWYILSRGKEKETRKAKNILKYSIYGFIVALTSFLAVASLFSIAGSKNKTGWYSFSCAEDSGSSVFGPSFKGETAYFPENKNQIIVGGNIIPLVTGEKKIMQIDPGNLDANNLFADIQRLAPEQKVVFVSASEDVSPEALIKYINNVSAGFGVGNLNSSDSQDGIEKIITLSPTDSANDFVVETGKTFAKYIDDSSLISQSGLDKITKALGVVSVTKSVEGKSLYAYVASGEPREDTDPCMNSGGEYTEFKNKCLAEKEEYDKKDVKCSDADNLVTGCKCPTGYYLLGNRCEKEDAIWDKTDPAKLKKVKTCADVTLEEKQCPASRCEGDKMMNYPVSVKDQCVNASEGAVITRNYCLGAASSNEADNQKCKSQLDSKSPEAKIKEAQDIYNKTGQSPDWYDKLLEKEGGFGQGSDFQGDQSGGGANGTGGGANGNGSSGNGNVTGATADTGPLPSDKGAGNFNPAPGFEELKKCIGLKDDQIPYNGILVVLMNPANFDASDRYLVNNHEENISKMYYLSREGKLIGKNGAFNEGVEGQEYGARDFKKGASKDSMWGRGWKIFKGPTKYFKGGWTDPCSYGSHDGYKIGGYTRNDQGNLGGGTYVDKKGRTQEDVQSMGRCGQHVGKKGSSAGCATMGNNSRCGFINTSKSYMTQSNGTIMQINLKGELNPANGKFSSPDCGKVDYCAAKKSFENSSAKMFKNDPNQGYESGDKRWVKCP